MDFKTAYKQAINFEGFSIDSAQAGAVAQLDDLYNKLLINKNSPGVLQNVWSKITGRKQFGEFVQGCYIWGDVGRGKTWLMDLFYQSLPFKEKSRLHFHEFMQQIHLRLKAINGKRDPLVTIAADIGLNNRVICLDEFHVSDITDAMLLYGLLDALYKSDVALLMTSNNHPDDLYKNGLQRSRFVPAIELIKERNLVLHVNGVEDFRLKSTDYNSNYITPLSSCSDSVLEEKFYTLAEGDVQKEAQVLINNREISYKMSAGNAIWFEFGELCVGPRAASDYLYLARNYEYVIVSNIFQMDENNDDIARRFINLIDALYDRRVGLIISAATLPEHIYTGSRFEKEFARTVSRLEEVRSSNPIPKERSVILDRNTLLSNP